MNPLWSPRARLSLLQTQPSHESGQWEPSSRSQLSGQLLNRKSGGTAGALQNVGAPTKYRTLMFSGSCRVRLLRRTATLALPGHEFLDARFFGRPQKAIPTKTRNVGAPTFPKWNGTPEVAA